MLHEFKVPTNTRESAGRRRRRPRRLMAGPASMPWSSPATTRSP